MKILDLLQKKKRKKVEKNEEVEVTLIPASGQIGSFIMAPEADTDFYLECNGAEYNRSDYPELIEVWDKYYSQQNWYQGSDNTKFRVPNHNQAGLFMRASLESNYTDGDITTGSTKLPNSPFDMTSSHTHTSNKVQMEAIPHNHRLGDNIWRNEEGDVYVQEGGIIRLGSGEKIYTDESNISFNVPATKTIEEKFSSSVINGGDSETAPIAFVTKFWVVVKPKLGVVVGLDSDIPFVESFNGSKGDIQITHGNEIEDNIVSVNNIMPDSLGEIHLDVSQIPDAVRSVNGQSGLNSVISGYDIPDIVTSINGVSGDVVIHLDESMQIQEKIVFLNQDLIKDPLATNRETARSFFFRLKKENLNYAVPRGAIGSIIPLLEGYEVLEDDGNLLNSFNFDFANERLFFTKEDIFINYIIEVKLTSTYSNSRRLHMWNCYLIRVLSDEIIQSDMLGKFESSSEKNAVAILNTYTSDSSDSFITNGIDLGVQRFGSERIIITGIELSIHGNFVKWNDIVKA